MGIYWTFNSINLAPIGGDRAIPEWHRELRVATANLLGTGLAEYNFFGYGEWKLQMDASITNASDYAAVRALHGALGTLSDGTTTWNDVVLLTEALQPVRGGWEGSVEFSRSGSS